MAPDRSSRSKRTRPRDDENGAATPLTAKKQRLDSVANSSPSTPRGFSALNSAIGRRGRPRAKAKGSNADNQDNGTVKSVYDVRGSSDDKKAIESQLNAFRPAIRYPKSLTLSRPIESSNIYDVPDSDDELGSPARAKGKVETNSKPKTTVSPRKNTVTRRRPQVRDDDNRESQEETETVEETAETPSRTQRRGRQWLGDSARQQRPTPKGILTPRHKRAGRPRKSVAFDSQSGTPTSEVYFADIPSKSKSAAAQPSPTKKAVISRGQGTRSDGKDDQKAGSGEEESDEEVCVICSKPDSRPRNEIIFCDHCNKAVHQKCYNVPIIPEDDWFCRDCLQEDVVPGATKDATEAQDSVTASDIPDIPNFAHHLQTMQRVLIDRCSGNRRIRLRGQDEAFENAFQLVEQTVLAGESNSMMIIGARGCGKTTLVDTIIADLSAENKEVFHVVRLNGFIHTDDKLALKEIWRQLGKEMDLEDEANKTSNYADTLASLLALLSHPSEITGSEEGVTSKSVIFVIDEFDLFATHARQTLLYNLFDIAQARKAPIAVLGLTTRIDVVESLEKRVKSRFSHRHVHLSLPKSLPAYWDICKQGLSVDEDDLESEGFSTNLEGLDEFLEYWDKHIESIRKTPGFQDHLEYHFTTTKSVSAFLTTCVLPLSSLSAESPRLELSSSAPESLLLEAPDSKMHLLTALSDLDLALLIAAARLDIVAHTDTVNFAMAYDEYSSQMGKQRVQSASSGMLALGAGGRLWGRDVAGTAWERLVSLGLLIPAGIGGRSNAAHGGLEGKMWKLDVCLDEIPAATELPGFLQKWCTQI